MPKPYYLTRPASDIEAYTGFRLDEPPPSAVHPDEPGLILTGEGPRHYQWGLEASWTKNEVPRIWNGRAESMNNTNWGPMFESMRALVPATSWSVGENRLCTVKNEPLFCFAAVWSPTETGVGPAHITFAILTRPSISGAKRCGRRMPLVVLPEYYELWLQGDPADLYTRMRSGGLNPRSYEVK